MELQAKTTTKKIKITPAYIREQAEQYQVLKATVSECNTELKRIEKVLKSDDNVYSDIQVDNKRLFISLSDSPLKFNLKQFQEDHPKLKWQDPKYFTQADPIKKITFKKLE